MTAISPSSNSSGLSAFVSRASPSSASNQHLTTPGHYEEGQERKKKGDCHAKIGASNRSKRKTVFEYV